MDVSGEAVDYVRVSKSNYQKALKTILHQHGLIKQQQVKLQATDNLFKLLQKKDCELRRSAETESSLRAALRRQEAMLQKSMTEKFFIESRLHAPAPKKFLESDSALLGDDMEADCAGPVPSSKDSLPGGARPSFIQSLITSESRMSNVMPLSSPASMQQSHSMYSLPSLTIDSSLHSRSAVSKDLMDKVMQQNARLKKAVREILTHKGLTVTDYLDKKEYEDAAVMLREDLKRQQNLTTSLRVIIQSRDRGEIDKLSEKCADLTTKVQQLEHKIALQQVVITEAYDKLADNTTKLAVSTSDKSTSTGSDLVSTEEQVNQLQEVQERIVTLEAANLDLKRTLEQEQDEKSRLLKVNQEYASNQKRNLEELNATKQQRDQLQKSYDSMMAEKLAIQSQLATFEEDFNMESKEKLELKQRLENSIAQHQEWIRQLAAEAQILRTKWQDEQALRERLESQLKGKSSPSLSPYSTASCAAEVKRLPFGQPLPCIVAEDGPEQRFICPRCERQFPSEDKLKQHCQRCTDE